MRNIFLLTLAVFLAAGAAAFAADIPKEEMSGASAVEKSGGSGVLSSMELYAGQNAVLKLKADKEAGYTWEIAEPWDEKVLEFMGKESLSPSSKGALGTEVWTFKALKTGKVELSFRYADAAGKSAPESKNDVFAVIVKEGSAGKTGPFVGQQAPYYLTGTVASIKLSDPMARVNPLLAVKKDSGELVNFVVKPLCFVYRGTGDQVSAGDISSGARVTVNYRVSKKGVNEAVTIKID
jgi:inhibitor of cysteine peptidase